MRVVKRVIKIGTSLGIILDKIIIDTLKLYPGEKVIVDIKRDLNGRK